MPQHHTEQEIFDFITGDFQCAWDALAEKPLEIAVNRGNFLFALQATVFLEWLCRLCKEDTTGKALQEFSEELKKIESKYFTELPAKSKGTHDFTLPGNDPTKTLLSAIWDMIRNGLAHEYHDMIVELTNGKKWVLKLRGVEYAWTLSRVAANRSSLQHLDYYIDSPDGDLLLIVHSGVLFLDIKDAACNAKLLKKLRIKHLSYNDKTLYQFTLAELEKALENGGHGKCESVSALAKISTPAC